MISYMFGVLITAVVEDSGMVNIVAIVKCMNTVLG